MRKTRERLIEDKTDNNKRKCQQLIGKEKEEKLCKQTRKRESKWNLKNTNNSRKDYSNINTYDIRKNTE